jgi:CRISPR-associated protein Cas1
MRPLVLSGFGVSVRVNRGQLEVRDDQGHRSYPPHALPFDSLVLEGYTGNISLEATRFLLVHGVTVSCLRWDGSLLGTLTPKGTNNAALKIAQVKAHQNPELRGMAARAILEAKARSTAQLCAHFSRVFGIAAPQFEPTPPSDSINELRLSESRSAHAYWSFFGGVIGKTWPDSGWLQRKSTDESWNRNARDPINALLNYSYSLVEGRVRSAISSVGLLPDIGLVHDIAPSKLPLVYDLQELFRWVADLSVVEVVSRGLIDRKMGFLRMESYHVPLEPETARVLTNRIAENFARTVRVGKRNFSLDTCVAESARILAHWLESPKAVMHFPPVFAAESHELPHAEAERIQSLSFQERKALGIRENTFHYLKRRAQRGKPIRVYLKVSNKIGL